MLKIKGNQIYLTRGDTASFLLDITDVEDKPYTFTKTTEITLSVKKNINDAEYVFQTTSIDTPTIEIIPEYTKDLEFGRYIYDVQLSCDGKIFTIIEPSGFYILEEVTT